MQIVQSLDEPHWRRFIAEHPGSNIFHTPEMFQVFARAKGYRPALWAAVDGGGHPLALLLPVQVTLMDGLARWVTTRAIAYGSVLSAQGEEGSKALEALLGVYTRETDKSVLYSELRNLSDQSPVQQAMAANGFVYEEHLNYLVNLARPAEDLLQSFGRRTRKKIRRALRQGDVTIHVVDDREGVALCYELLLKSYAAAQVPLADRSLFEAAFDVLHSQGMVQFLLAWLNGECIATSVELAFKDTVYGWYGGVDRAFGSYVPNELLMWHILEWGAENGYRQYDFGGAGKPDEEYGVRDFKAKFGGQLVCYGRNTCVHAPLRLAASKAGYQIYRGLMSGRAR